MKEYHKLLSYLKGYYAKLCLNLVFNLLTALFSVFSFLMLIPFLQLIFNEQHPVSPSYSNTTFSIKSFIQDTITVYLQQIIETNGRGYALAVICIITLLVFFLKNLFRYLALYILAPIKTGIPNLIRQQLYSKILYLDTAQLKQQQKGELLTTLTNDIQEIETGILFFLEVILREPITIIVLFIILLLISTKLTLFVLLLLPLSAYVIAGVGKNLKQQSLQTQGLQSSLTTMTDEAIIGNITIKSYNLASSLINQFKLLNHTYFTFATRMLRKRDLSSPLSEFLGIGVVLIVLYVGGSYILNNNASINAATFITYIVIFSQIIQPAKLFSNSYYYIQRTLASIQRINSVMALPEEIIEPQKTDGAFQLTKHIQLKQLSYKIEDKIILDNISCIIPKGKKVAIVGASGSGKTTLSHLLLKLIEPTNGIIYLDDTNYNSINTSDLRNLIAYVPQYVFLFNDSLKRNITLAAPDNKEQLIHATQQAQLYDFINAQPQQWHTIIGDNGIKLSGGERQRLALARAFYKDSSIIILDEATAHLDSNNEQFIQDAIANFNSTKTLIIIAHRLSTIKNCDLIFVLDNGKLVEQGTHAELMQQQGCYFKLYNVTP